MDETTKRYPVVSGDFSYYKKAATYTGDNWDLHPLIELSDDELKILEEIESEQKI